MSQLRLLDYQDTWPAQFQRVADELGAVLAIPADAIAHIGSTAVPGLCAKPVLDVMLGMDSLAEADGHHRALRELGYTYRPEYEGRLPERRYFVRAEASTLRVHLHGVVRGGRLWNQHLAFRNALRQDARIRTEYAMLKQSLALAHADNKQAYTDAKAPFILRVLATAGRARAG